MKIYHYTEVPKDYSIRPGSPECPLIELEPCPFCGGRAFLTASDKGIYGHCSNCGIEGPRDEHEMVAINKWNKRTEPSALHTKHTFVLREIANKGLTLEFVAEKFGLDNPDELKNINRMWKDEEYTILLDILGMSVEEFRNRLFDIENNAFWYLHGC